MSDYAFMGYFAIAAVIGFLHLVLRERPNGSYIHIDEAPFMDALFVGFLWPAWIILPILALIVWLVLTAARRIAGTQKVGE